MKKILPVLAIVLVFMLGLGVMLYPTIAEYVNARIQAKVIDSYDSTAAEESRAYYEGLLQQAQAFNEELSTKGGLAILTPEEHDEYESLLNLNGDGVMGYIEIPRLELKLSIGHGTEEDVLTSTFVAVTALLFTNHANVAAPSAMAATSTMAIAAPSCFFSAFVSITDPFPIPFLLLWNRRPAGSRIP